MNLESGVRCLDPAQAGDDQDVRGVAVLRIVDVAEDNHRRPGSLHLLRKQEAKRRRFGRPTDCRKRGAEIVLVLGIDCPVRPIPALAIDLCRTFRLEVTDIDMDRVLILPRKDGEMQDRPGEAADIDADRRRLRVVARALQDELLRKADDPFRLADHQALADDRGADDVRAVCILGHEEIVFVGKARGFQRLCDRGFVPEFLKAEDIRMQEADHPLRPVDLEVVFRLRPAVLVGVDRRLGLVEIVEIEGANAQLSQFHGRGLLCAA